MKKQEPITIYLSKYIPPWKCQVVFKQEGNVSTPIAFIKKAKNAPDKEYWAILDALFKPD